MVGQALGFSTEWSHHPLRIRGSGWCGESIGWYLSRDGLRITSLTCQCLMEIFHCRHSRDKFS
ncbi:hypothetical protein YC2023_081048 [Brassica napus]